jgi:hypothetical protein
MPNPQSSDQAISRFSAQYCQFRSWIVETRFRPRVHRLAVAGIRCHARSFQAFVKRSAYIDFTADTGPRGRMVVTITLADGGGSNEDLAAAADRLLSGFSFDHRFVFRTEEAPR